MSRSTRRSDSTNNIYLLTGVRRFLLVSLHIEAILAEVTIRQRRKKLEAMTKGNGLSDAYTETLTRLKAQKGNKSALGLKVLMWVLYSERPMTTKELCHAMGVELGSTDLDHENIPALRTLLASSLGLVTVEASSSTVRLLHFTLQEHLLSDQTLFHSSHSTIAEVCLTYLNFQCVRDLSPTLDSAPTSMPLLEYASYYWGEHTRKGMTENVKELALRLLNKFDEHISAQLLSLHYNEGISRLGPEFHVEKGPIGFTGLHGAAFLGIMDIFPAVLEMKEWDFNARDNASCTPFMWAAVRGHEQVAQMLLKRGDVDPNLADSRWNQPPLMWAVEHGHEGTVKVILERENVNPDQASPLYDPAALYIAAAYGHEGIVRMLLEREDVNPNQIATRFPYTTLSIAARNKREGVVRILLEREDVNPNLADPLGSGTPLSGAAAEGHEVIVKMLLERKDIRIDIQDHKNQTALSLALSRGYDKIARMISERTIKPETADLGSKESLPPSAADEDESIADKELKDDYPNTNIANLSGEPTSPPGDPDVPEELSDWEGSVPDSAESIVPSTRRPVLLSSFPCGLRGAGVPEVKLPLIQTILRQLSQSRSTNI